MATFVFINNFRTTLASAINTTATSITLASSAGLPTLGVGQQMPLTLNDAATGNIYEICYVTAITGATLTVIRAQEGTTAQNWAIGDYAFVGPTADTIAPAQYLITTLSASTALTPAQAGVVSASGTITLTLPSASSYPGLSYDIVNAGTGVITISGSSNIGPSSLSSVTLSQKGQQVTLTTDGTNWWVTGGYYDTTNIFYIGSTTSLSASVPANVIWPTKNLDILSEYNASGIFTPQETGTYEISIIAGFSASTGAFVGTVSGSSGNLGSDIICDISFTSAILGALYGSTTANLTKGTAYYIVCESTVSTTFQAAAFNTSNSIKIKRLLH